jgi:hypothetical protein
MKKIKTVFKIDRETNLATNNITPGAEWVLKGEGVATLKVDGSACMVKDGVLYKRYDRKLQSKYMKQARALGDKFVVTEDMFNVLPSNAIPCQEKPDAVTYHHPHWVEIDKNKPEDSFHVKALESMNLPLADGTYELLGPKVNNNPYGLTEYKLAKHGEDLLNVPDRSFDGIKSFLEQLNGEGIVFYHPEGEMLKIRRKDMGYFWNHDDTRNLNAQKKNKM